jgi:hypothetical protein
MDVVYEGIRLTPAQIARSAVDEGVHVIGLSILSGSHRGLIPDVVEALREAGGGRDPGRAGGIIPAADVEPLRAAGVAAGLHAEGLRDHADPARRRRRSWPSATGSPPRRERGASSARACATRDLAAAPAALNLLENRSPARASSAALLAEVAPARSAARRPATSSASPGRRAPASRRCSAR